MCSFSRKVSENIREFYLEIAVATLSVEAQVRMIVTIVERSVEGTR